MGKYEKGILGSFQGTVGTVTGSTWKGIEVMKIKRKKGMPNPTKQQIVQQAKFSFMIKFVSALSKLFAVSFRSTAVKMTGVNGAFRYNYQNALTGVYPSFSLDHSKVLVSKGELLNANNPVAIAGAGGLVEFTWTDNSGLAQAQATDKAIMVVYCPELNRSVYITNGPVRTSGTAAINAGIFSGRTVHTWLAFISEDEREVASSVYTGQVVVS